MRGERGYAAHHPTHVCFEVAEVEELVVLVGSNTTETTGSVDTHSLAPCGHVS